MIIMITVFKILLLMTMMEIAIIIIINIDDYNKKIRIFID